jgi:hypothetical protein
VKQLAGQLEFHESLQLIAHLAERLVNKFPLPQMEGMRKNGYSGRGYN